MTTRLARFMTLLAISVLGGICPTSAHEMTPNTFWNESFADGCLGGDMLARQSTRVASEIKRPECPLMATVQAELHSTYKILQDYSASIRRVVQSAHGPSLGAFANVDLWTNLGPRAKLNCPTLAVSSPAIGQPPSPHRNKLAKPFAMRSWTKGEFIENYRPYDFSIQDWRFGQIRETQTSPSSAPLQSDGSAQIIIARATIEAWLRNATEYQHIVIREFSTMDRVGQWTESIVRQMAESHRHLVETISAIALKQLNHEPVQPYYTTPAWVVHELPNGQKVVLTLAQARHWELVSSFGVSDVNLGGRQFAECPIRAFLRDRLDFEFAKQYSSIDLTAMQMPQWLTKWIDQIAETRVAQAHTEAKGEQR